MSSTELALLPVKIDERWVAIEARLVLDIRAGLDWIPITGTPAHVRGVLAWRDRAIAVLDLGSLLGIVEDARPKRRRLVIMRIGANTFAVPVDAIREVQHVELDAVRPAHVTSERYSPREVTLYEMVMPLLDPDRVAAAVVPESHEAT